MQFEKPWYASRMTTLDASLSRLSEQELIDRFGRLVRCDRRNTVLLLVAIAEIDERKLWATRACSSMFEFCVRHYGMSEAVTAKRIWAARTARRFPVVLAMLERGDLHLGAIHLLARHLTPENHRCVLERARHRSSREIEKLIAEIAPQPDVPSRVRALPRREFSPARPSPGDRCHGEAVRVHVPVPVPARPARSAQRQVRALAPRRFKIEITVDEETHEKLRRLQDLLAHREPHMGPAAVVSRAIDALLAETLQRKAALTDRPRPRAAKESARPHREASGGALGSPRSRRIPAAVRREVWLRDGGTCVFVDHSGERCGAARFLEFHHREPFGKGGRHEAANIELRCQAHNQLQADLDFGVEFMNARRRGTFPGERPGSGELSARRGDGTGPPGGKVAGGAH